MLASLLLDGFGWLGVAQEPFTAVAGLGGAAVVAGAWLIAGARTALPARGAWLVARPRSPAPCCRSRARVNARLRADVDAPVAVGARLVPRRHRRDGARARRSRSRCRSTARPRVAPLRGMPWWGWLGGAVGATYVTSVFLLIPEIGAAPTIGLTVAGQQLASVLVDRHGLLRLPRRPITARRLAGVAVLLAGVALVQLG